MTPILLGEHRKTRARIYLEPDMFRTHMHLIGATGTGKTTAIHAILRSLMLQVGTDECSLFVIDPMGNLSRDLLNFIAHPTFCTKRVRERLVYIEPAREDMVMSFNPLTFTTPANRYYQTMRAVDLVLRGWAAQDVSQQPRLLQWTFKAFCAAAMMGLPISMCQHLLHTGTSEHEAILNRIPGSIRNHWMEILNARGSAATTILESTRNRLDPFFESPILKMMFGSRRSRFDCERFIRDRKIVIVNLAKLGRVPELTADTIGALMLNEIFETASRMTTTMGRSAVDPTYVLLDEFQKYVSPDIEDALPTVRQMGLRLILAHQSFSQLDREDLNLEQMVWQARSRLIFASYAKDADLLVDELAKLTFNNKVKKDVRTSKKQLITGHRIEWLESQSESDSVSTGSSNQNSSNEGETTTYDGERRLYGYGEQLSEARSRAKTESSSNNKGESRGRTAGRSQTLVPTHMTFDEVSSVTFESFEEYALKWGKELRSLKEGQAFLQLPGSNSIQPVQVDYLPIEETPQLRDAVEELVEKNFASEHFVTQHQANIEYEQCWQEMLRLPLQGRNESSNRSEDGGPLLLPKPQSPPDAPPSPFTL
jgi:hypothetical protein